MKKCSICLEIYSNCVKLSCGCNIDYCIECILTWFNQNRYDKCPICKKDTIINNSDVDFEVYINNGIHEFVGLNNDYIVLLKNNELEITEGGILFDLIINFIKKIYGSVKQNKDLLECLFYPNEPINITGIDNVDLLRNKFLLKLHKMQYDINKKAINPIFEIVGSY